VNRGFVHHTGQKRQGKTKKDMEAMCGTGYERKEYWGGKYS